MGYFLKMRSFFPRKLPLVIFS